MYIWPAARTDSAMQACSLPLPALLWPEFPPCCFFRLLPWQPPLDHRSRFGNRRLGRTLTALIERVYAGLP
jgi:hypothetical protein